MKFIDIIDLSSLIAYLQSLEKDGFKKIVFNVDPKTGDLKYIDGSRIIKHCIKGRDKCIEIRFYLNG